MILDTNTPGALDARVIDTDTGCDIEHVVRLDSATGFLERIVNAAGKLDGLVGCKWVVQIEERRNFRVYHRTTGQLICQHPR